MKNIFILIMAILSACKVDARDYLPVYTEGKVWNYSYYTMVDNKMQKGEYQWYVVGDTIVGGKNCKIISSRNIEDPINIFSREKEVVYENDKKVYSVEDTDNSPEFKLRLDFNLNLGDHFKINLGLPDYNVDFYVSSSDSVMGGDIKRKRIILAYGEDSFDKGQEADCWIEGIGTTLTTWLENTLAGTTTSSSHLVKLRFDSCYDGDVCIYKNDELPPTPSDFTGIESVKTDNTDNGKMYNLNGQQVGKNYKGVVIQNGKKFYK